MPSRSTRPTFFLNYCYNAAPVIASDAVFRAERERPRTRHSARKLLARPRRLQSASRDPRSLKILHSTPLTIVPRLSLPYEGPIRGRARTAFSRPLRPLISFYRLGRPSKRKNYLLWNVSRVSDQTTARRSRSFERGRLNAR